jgi:hypothetical protein
VSVLHGGVVVDSVLLRYGAASLGDWLQTFRRNIDEGKIFLQNVANRVTFNAASRHRKTDSEEWKQVSVHM